MNRRPSVFKSIALVAALICSFVPTVFAQQNSKIKQLLLARNHEFREDLIQVSERVYTVTGIGLQPVSMIVGDDGLVIVDTNFDVVSGKKIMAKFRSITDKPVKAIIFTHGHRDHTGGAAAFAEEDTQIWARASFGSEDRPLEAAGITITRKLGIRHGGILLPEDDIKHIGVVKRYRPLSLPEGSNLIGAGPVKPTHTFDGDQETIRIAGLELELVAANGETNDQLYVWYATDRVVFTGDNFYKSWPNLYTLRGTGYRDVHAWINSLSSMLDKQPHHLVAGHTRPILGKEEATAVLTNYRDAIKYLFEKTIEGMNKGLTPDELVEYAQLPKKYRELDYLRPYYGHPDWGVRSIYNGYLGWFDGNPTSLFPLKPREEAQRMIDLAGGAKAMKNAMQEAIEAGEYQWALKLVDHLLTLTPDEKPLMNSKADILMLRAEQTLNTSARNYYRSYALELREAAKN